MKQKILLAVLLISGLLIFGVLATIFDKKIFFDSGMTMLDSNVEYFGESYMLDVNSNEIYYRHSIKSFDPLYVKETSVSLKDADPKTFEALDVAGYARDKKNVWYQGNLISEDSDNFQFLEDGRFQKDSTKVFIGKYLVEGAGIDTFRLINKNLYLYGDVDTLYLLSGYGEIIYLEDFDTANAEQIGPYIADGVKVVHVSADDFRGYSFTEILEADAASFRQENGIYRDDNKLYLRHYYCGILEECIELENKFDLNTVVKIDTPDGHAVLKDLDTVVFLDRFGDAKEVVGADAKTFEVLGKCLDIDKPHVPVGIFSGYSKDKDTVFATGSFRATTLDPKTLVVYEGYVPLYGEGFPELTLGLRAYFAKDKGGVYLQCDKKIKGLNPDLFSLRRVDNGQQKTGVVLYDGTEYGQDNISELIDIELDGDEIVWVAK